MCLSYFQSSFHRVKMCYYVSKCYTSNLFQSSFHRAQIPSMPKPRCHLLTFNPLFIERKAFSSLLVSKAYIYLSILFSSRDIERALENSSYAFYFQSSFHRGYNSNMVYGDSNYINFSFCDRLCNTTCRPITL